MLDPDNRLLYTSALMPPPGMVFDEAIATAFSMDPRILLEAPVYLAMLASDDGQNEPDGIAVMESVRRYADRIDVYVQKGRILVPESGEVSNPLYGFLERMTFEVDPKRGGVFHPKIWLIRFKSAKKYGDEVLYRLLVTSRNLTGDNSWDLALSLEGRLDTKRSIKNRPLSDFIASLPKISSKQDRNSKERAERMSKELNKVVWDLPEGFDELEFYLPGHKKYGWHAPKSSKAMLVISPFCSDEALNLLYDSCRESAYLVSREESLKDLEDDTLEKFVVFCLDPDVQPTDDDLPKAAGLHAKAYIFEEGWDTRIVMGSANATNAALVYGTNYEILVSLKGKRSRIGSIEEILESQPEENDGGVLGQYLIPFEKSIDEEKVGNRACDDVLGKARDRIAKMPMKLLCHPLESSSKWEIFLDGFDDEVLSDKIELRLWPITVHQKSSVDFFKDKTAPLYLGEFDIESVCGLLAFELCLKDEDAECRLSFVLNLPVEGVSFKQRQSAIMKRMIENWETFRRYLTLFLMEEKSAAGGEAAFKKQFFNGEFGHFSAEPLLEELLKVFVTDPEKLDRISEMIDELGEDGREIVDKDFLALWKIFEEARRQ